MGAAPWPGEPSFFGARRAWPLGLLAFAMPGWGWLLAGALAFGLERPRPDGAEEAEDEEAGEAPLGQRARFLESIDVVSVADAIVSEDPALKRGAIETLAKIRTPAAIAWLLKTRSDQDPEARFYATSSLTSLKREYEERLKLAEKEALEKPSRADLRTGFCRLLHEYAVSGLADPLEKAQLLRKCARWLADRAEDDEESLALLYRVERERSPERALSALERLASLGGDRSRWARERIELLFSLGRYRETREAMRRLGASGGDKEWEAAALWWAAARKDGR